MILSHRIPGIAMSVVPMSGTVIDPVPEGSRIEKYRSPQ